MPIGYSSRDFIYDEVGPVQPLVKDDPRIAIANSVIEDGLAMKELLDYVLKNNGVVVTAAANVETPLYFCVICSAWDYAVKKIVHKDTCVLGKCLNMDQVQKTALKG